MAAAADVHYKAEGPQQPAQSPGLAAQHPCGHRQQKQAQQQPQLGQDGLDLLGFKPSDQFIVLGGGKGRKDPKDAKKEKKKEKKKKKE